MKYYVVSSSIEVHKINAKNLNKALFDNVEFYGFKKLEDAQRLANDGQKELAQSIYAVYEVQVDGKKGIKAQDCTLEDGDVIKGAVVINRRQVSKFVAVSAHIGDQAISLNNVDKTPVASEEEVDVAPKAKAKAKAKAKTAAKGKAKKAAKPEAEEVVVEKAPKAKKVAKGKGKTKAIEVEVKEEANEDAKAPEASNDKLFKISLPVAAAITVPAATALLVAKGFVASSLAGVTAGVAATGGLFALVLGAVYAAKLVKAKYDRYQMTQQQRHDVDFAADKEQLQKLEEALANKTDADSAFIVHMHDLEEAAPAAKFKEDGSDVEDKPSFTKAQVVQFELYAMKKLAGAEDRAKAEAELADEADKKFTVKA